MSNETFKVMVSTNEFSLRRTDQCFPRDAMLSWSGGDLAFLDYDQPCVREGARLLGRALARWADTGELVDPGEAPAPAPARPSPEPSPGGVMPWLVRRVEKLEDFVANLGLDARLVTNMCGGIGETKDRLTALEGDRLAARLTELELLMTATRKWGAETEGNIERIERGLAQHDKLFIDMDERLRAVQQQLDIAVSHIWTLRRLSPRLASLETHAALRWVPEKGEHETVDLAEPGPAAKVPSYAEIGRAYMAYWREPATNDEALYDALVALRERRAEYEIAHGDDHPVRGEEPAP